MKIYIAINCVNGDTYSMSTTIPKEAEDFLEKFDHEGSTVDVSVNSSDNEDAYKVVQWIHEGYVK